VFSWSIYSNCHIYFIKYLNKGRWIILFKNVFINLFVIVAKVRKIRAMKTRYMKINNPKKIQANRGILIKSLNLILRLRFSQKYKSSMKSQKHFICKKNNLKKL
jgi:hypothetical protein